MSGGQEQRTRQAAPQQELIWDPVVRIGHWLLVVLMAYTYFAEHVYPGHDVAGYIILAIVVWRIYWGFAGSRYARFSAFVYSPKETLEYTLSALRLGEAREYKSHNPMGALMVFLILFWVLALVVSGVLVHATLQMSGPLEGFIPVNWDLTLEKIHYGLAWAFLPCIGLHVLGTVWASWWHRENYLWAMITGRKSRYQRRRKRTSAADRKTPAAPSTPASPSTAEPSPEPQRTVADSCSRIP